MPRALHDLNAMLHSIALQVYRQHESFATQVKQFIEIGSKYMYLVDFLQCLEYRVYKESCPKMLQCFICIVTSQVFCEYLNAVNVAD